MEAFTLAELVARDVDVGMAYWMGNARSGNARKCKGRRYVGLSAVTTFALERAAAGDTAEQERGSSRSAQLHEAAVSIHKRSNRQGVWLMFLHVSGKQLVAEGIDKGSRRFAAELRGTACGAGLREVVHRFARRAGGAITIDYFASASNAMAAAELVDAFVARSWDQWLCPCGHYHRETGSYFPPNGLEERVVRLAKLDGARGSVLVPINRKAAYYMCLMQFAAENQSCGVGAWHHGSAPATAGSAPEGGVGR
jgi:hypothetical protein